MTSLALPRGAEAVLGWNHPAAPAQPVQQQALEQTLAKLRAWTPYDGDVWLDDVADALDDVPPAEEDIEELAQRLRGYLMQFVSIAVSREAEQRHQRAGRLIARARQVREQEMPGDYRQATTHLRCMGWTVNELLEVLVEIGAVKEPDSLRHPLRAVSA
ncbi:DUF6415 family natural product biosynthesis protein [Streptomyces sp. NPDC049915]|uniref:DUF6415 family natural product biosynthesis protein n=1 Tax=Streptomyces sp. NPDC049915 TaxID=3155510 RepID=UPI003414A15E